MHRSSTLERAARLALAVALLIPIASSALAASPPHGAPVVVHSVRNGRAPAVPPRRPGGRPGPREIPNGAAPGRRSLAPGGDPVVQRRAGATVLQPVGEFEGGAASDDETLFGGRLAPPDTNGDVGLNHYVQYLNLIVTMYNKSDGSVALGPLPGNAFWAGFGGFCETQNRRRSGRPLRSAREPLVREPVRLPELPEPAPHPVRGRVGVG